MSDELNPQSSQPAADASVSPGTNSAGQPSEPSATPSTPSTMTPSQDADYYNKTQQLAQDKRQFEQERAAWEQQRSGAQPPQGEGQGQVNNGYFQNPNPGQSPGYAPAPAPVPELPIDPQDYALLVEQFGKEVADIQVRLIQKTHAANQQKISELTRRETEREFKGILNDLNARGSQAYGEEWKAKGPEVLRLVAKAGIPLENAWYAINGASIEQRARDQAYQAQQAKEAGNVNQGSVQPAATHLGKFNSFQDAFDDAYARSQR